MGCGITFKGVAITGDGLQACEDSCFKDISDAGTTDSQCSSAKAKVSAMSCADFVAFLNANGR